MGAANVVPGVSGGTIALITGIYARIIEALNAVLSVEPWRKLLKKDVKGFWAAIDGRFLLALGIGLVVSILSLAKLIEYCSVHYPIMTWAFFFGLILASLFFMLRDVKDWKILDAVQITIGIIVGVLICTLSPTQTPDAMWFIFICGVVGICSMILPGLSGSLILMILGKYDYIIGAISDMNIGPLAVFAAGCVVGILAFAKLLHWLLARYERGTMLVLIGFVAGSLVKVWPWADKTAIVNGDLQIPGAILWCAIGVASIVLIEVLGARKK